MVVADSIAIFCGSKARTHCADWFCPVMLAAKTTFLNRRIASFHLALFLGVHVLATPSPRMSGRVAPLPRAESVATMFTADPHAQQQLYCTLH